ncbi:DUF4123 domain-containing protein [Pseudomonas syringae]|uniref:DUF4123 domain-containing protein n=1 Tax=Pseudomonas syringae TaxID=317 RepID=UPI001F19EAAC|nr:DUF4123 domain-containing protein [Pseudomonas syringae]MBL3831339.1 DUF4123 domain-containing protein [Pseudomonas syringae pv. theae]MBL3838370.1 DUF4123 domain-containing protein [Pseudomonas syringae pv. theae]MBL3865831.1 DUF4123 domain-containing protein [Pseudomonas syringae pv. theae]GKQ43968.1 DUF4123 domain-containing protein [Pseudomonas syringae pv. theae]
MQEHYTLWIEQIESLCGSANVGHVDVMVDQAGWDISILPALHLMEPGLSWFSLFSATPEEALLTQAPILMRINLDDWRHKAWLEELVEQAGHLSRLMLLISPMPFDVLAKSLQGLSQLEWGGQSGLLRFYDPRVMPEVLASVLSPEQKEQFLRVTLFWSWLDRDQRPVWQPGTYRSNQTLAETFPLVSLADAQFDRLGSISDAQSLLEVARSTFSELSNEQCFAWCYRMVLKASQEKYFGDLKLYAALHLNSADTV